MTTDGHTGFKNSEISRRKSNHFELVLSHLERRNDDSFVMHAVCYTRTKERAAFLKWLGFSPSTACQFGNSNKNVCSWKEIAITRAGSYYSHERLGWMIAGFQAFAGHIDDLLHLHQQFNAVLAEIHEAAGPLPIFNAPVDITADPGEIPSWVDQVKSPELKSLENDKRDLESKISDLSGHLLLVAGTGDPLEDAVTAALRCLGLEAEKAEKGATVDIFAWKDGGASFGFEVTGLNDSIKKSSRKLTQVMEFERLKDDAQKTVLLANTHNATPVNERPAENFTVDVANFLSPHPILMMTGYDLYRLVLDVRAGTKSAKAVVEDMRTMNGVYRYS
jgi:hypothetical protein